MEYKELKKIIKEEKEIYKEKDYYRESFHVITNHPYKIFQKVLETSRKYRYYKENARGIFNKIKFLYYSTKNNKNVFKYQMEINGELGKNIIIYHNNVIINYNAKLGDNVILHGNNCIGNNLEKDKAPVIGNNVEIGYGAIIIGDIKIADDIIIGANSLVNKSFTEPGIKIAGVPAKKIYEEK